MYGWTWFWAPYIISLSTSTPLPLAAVPQGFPLFACTGKRILPPSLSACACPQNVEGQGRPAVSMQPSVRSSVPYTEREGGMRPLLRPPPTSQRAAETNHVSLPSIRLSLVGAVVLHPSTAAGNTCAPDEILKESSPFCPAFQSPSPTYQCGEAPDGRRRRRHPTESSCLPGRRRSFPSLYPFPSPLQGSFLLCYT